MKNNKYQLPTFWWLNPWAHARYLINASEELGARWVETCEKLDDNVAKYAQELSDHCQTHARLDVALDQIDALEAEIMEFKQNGRQYSQEIKNVVRKASAEGLTLKDACKKYKLNPGSARTIASLIGVSFKWTGKGRKPKIRG